MHVASLELSKQLFEVSGWHDRDGEDFAVPRVGAPPTYAQRYTLGFILRKLPAKLPVTKINNWFQLHQLHPDWGNWCACYSNSDIRQQANTPEDAACKLAIELFHQAILKRKGEK